MELSTLFGIRLFYPNFFAPTNTPSLQRTFFPSLLASLPPLLVDLPPLLLEHPPDPVPGRGVGAARQLAHGRLVLGVEGGAGAGAGRGLAAEAGAGAEHRAKESQT